MTSPLQRCRACGGMLMLAILASGCSNSLLVSPSVHNLGGLDAGSVNVGASSAMLPETMPEEAGTNLSPGFEARVGYQFSSAVRIEAKYFGAFTTTSMGFFANGFGLLGTISLSSDEDLEWILVGQGQAVLNGADIEGFGVAPEVGIRYDATPELSIHTLAGPAYGAYDATDSYFLGGILNAGLSWQLFPQFYLGLDVATLLGYDAFADVTRGVVSPSLQLSYTIPTR